MRALEGAALAANWTTAAGAVEGILTYLGEPLPRHAVMGLSGHAWHTAVSSRHEIHVLPDGPVNLDWSRMAAAYGRLGWHWERFGASLAPGDDWEEQRTAAIEWTIGHLEAGRPVAGWDFHLHEFCVIYGYDRDQSGFLVESVVTPEVGPLALWSDWPSSLGLIELLAPTEPHDVEPAAVVHAALRDALESFAGGPEAPPWGANRDARDSATVLRGTNSFEHWAQLLEGEEQIDRAGNAYCIALYQAAREDGARFLDDIAEGVPELERPLRAGSAALREMVKAMSPLVTLFPFPAGGHGNVDNPGLRRAAAMPLRRCADYERAAAAAIEDAAGMLEG